MHPTIINRILDLAATKVAAQFDHQTVIDQAGTTGFCVGVTRVSHGMRLRPPQKNMIAIPNDFAWW